MSVGNTPTFADVDEVDCVYRFVLELRDKGRTAKNIF